MRILWPRSLDIFDVFVAPSFLVVVDNVNGLFVVHSSRILAPVDAKLETALASDVGAEC